MRKAREQKKDTEIINQPYGGRTRSRKGNQEEGNKDGQQIDINKDYQANDYKEKGEQIRIDKDPEKSLIPVDQGKTEDKKSLENNNNPETDSKMEDEYNHYESASEEEMEETSSTTLKTNNLRLSPSYSVKNNRESLLSQKRIFEMILTLLLFLLRYLPTEQS